MLPSTSGFMSSHLPSIASFNASDSLGGPSPYNVSHASQLAALDAAAGLAPAGASQTGDALGKALASVCVDDQISAFPDIFVTCH